jgi:hypothetical protein
VGLAQAEWAQDPVLQQGPERLAGDLAYDLAEDDEVRVGVVEALPRLAQPRPPQGDVEDLVGRELLERVAVEVVDERRVLLDPVGQPGRGRRQLQQADLAGIGDLGEILGQRVVERQPPGVAELEQDVDHVRDRDRPDPGLHPQARRHPGERLARRRLRERALADVHAHQRRAQVLGRHRLAHDSLHPLARLAQTGAARGGADPRTGARLACLGGRSGRQYHDRGGHADGENYASWRHQHPPVKAEPRRHHPIVVAQTLGRRVPSAADARDAATDHDDPRPAVGPHPP